jgi:hypothetical protein
MIGAPWRQSSFVSHSGRGFPYKFCLSFPDSRLQDPTLRFLLT